MSTSQTYQLGSLRIAPNLVLAPMEGVTCIVFRRLIRSIGGCGLTTTEFVPAAGLSRNLPRVRDMVRFDPDERPLAIQLYGRDPVAMAEGARIVEDLGADLLDINMGCPSKKVCAHSGGSALMRDPDLARRIVAAARAATSLPLTVKMRAGWDERSRNAPDFAWMCQEEGAQGVTVHWRTRMDLYGGERNLDIIRAVKDRVDIPVLANGDVVDAQSAVQTLAATGADGLMIGRGAVRNPWVFHEIGRALRGEPPLVVDDAERKRVLLDYFERIRGRFRSEKGALGRFKKIARYFTQGVEGGDVLRQRIFHSQHPDEAIEVVHAFFSSEAARREPTRPAAATG